MPVIVNAKDPHPFLPSLGDPAAIEAERAKHQDIRPLEIAIVNLMADKPKTEGQLAYWLGTPTVQVNLTFAATDSYIDNIRNGRESRNTPPDHIQKFYNPFRAIKGRKFDGLVVTGFNARESTVDGESIWPEVQEIFEWSKTDVFSSCFLCWGAKAALKHFHDIDSIKAAQKYLGVFDHHVVSDTTGILKGFPDVFPIPVSRWKTPRREDIARCTTLEVVAETEETGPSIMAESAPYDDGQSFYPKRLYVLPHPEYDTTTLQGEYERDLKEHIKDPIKNPAPQLPENYFPGNDPLREPKNSWRHTAHVYTNWVKAIYEATPYEIAQVPQPFIRPSPAGGPP